MFREKHPIHAVSKKAGQLNRALKAMEKSATGRRPTSQGEMVRVASRLDRLASREMAVYKNTGSVSHSSLMMMMDAYLTLRGELQELKGLQMIRSGKAPKMIQGQERLFEWFGN